MHIIFETGERSINVSILCAHLSGPVAPFRETLVGRVSCNGYPSLLYKYCPTLYNNTHRAVRLMKIIIVFVCGFVYFRVIDNRSTLLLYDICVYLLYVIIVFELLKVLARKK